MANDRIVLGGITTDVLTEQQLLDIMSDHCLATAGLRADGRRRAPKLVYSSNGQIISGVARSPDLGAIMEQGDIVHADGMSLVFASRLVSRTALPERITMADFFYAAAEMASEKGLSFYLLGGTDEDNAKCAEIMQARYPRLVIAGRDSRRIATEEDELAVCEAINRVNPDIVWVGLGFPKQVRFCGRNRHRIDAGWLVTCGGCFSYVTGTYPRAPVWMQRAGLEWLFRVLSDPRQFLMRYVTTNFHALWLLLTRSSNVVT